MLYVNSSLQKSPKRPGLPVHPAIVARRDMSLTAHFKKLSLCSSAHHGIPTPLLSSVSCSSTSPSKLPKPTTPVPKTLPSLSRTCFSPTKRIKKARSFLTTDTTIENFDFDEQYHDFKRMFADYQHMYKDSMEKVEEARNETNVFKEAITKIEQERSSQTENMVSLRSENEMLKYRVQSLEESLAALRKEQLQQLDDLRRRQKEELEVARNEQRAEIERIKMDHREEIRLMKQRHQDELDHERTQKVEALSQVSTQGALDKQRHQMDIEKKEQEVSLVKQEVERINSALEREKELNDDLRKNLSSAGDTAASMETARQGLQAKIAYLESDSKSQSEAYAAMEKRMNEALQKAGECEEKLRREETLRRKLHNQVQELKGNIRVFCRVRPNLDGDEDLAKMKYPDAEESTEIEVRGQEEVSSLGKDITKTYPFTYDRVFSPECTNEHIFTEISQLIQSALDGYNVCIFAYGQTGSGKTYTMSADDGMIPCALRQIYSTSKDLESRGWKYSMEGSFVEVYNEELRDLLGDENSTKKHEIRHDMAKMETTITDVTALNLDSQEQVEQILTQAMSRRSVAATKANERSSRSHSVFILKLKGENSITGERSKGTLNLVDLAGSERIRNSDTAGNAARLKETQNINKSLSCLGDVIGALGQGVGASPTFDGRASLNSAPPSSHIPYRNSKLTYLLQFSLGGNSKTLMFVMVAPEKKCLGETITSLKFAEKVAKTKVGVAKKVR